MPERLNESGGAIYPLLLAALRSAQIGVALKDVNGSYFYVSGLPDYFPDIPLAETTDASLFGEEWSERMLQVQRDVLQTGVNASVELLRTTNSQYSACQCTVQRYRMANERHAILMTFLDLTPERKREDTFKALLRELSHRSKNLLAIVQSIAFQTALTSKGLDLFLVKFRGRIAALSAAQDLVTDSNWRGAQFFELAARQFGRYLEAGDPRISIDGTDILLSPNGATHVGLALHELIVNATTHGGLSSPRGSIAVRSHSVRNGGGRMHEIEWEEHAPEDMKFRGTGAKQFGSAVLERVVPASLNGEALYEIGPQSVRYRLRFPADDPS